MGKILIKVVVLFEGNAISFFFTQGKSSGLQGNTKTRSAAVHYKQLLAVGPEILHSERRKDTA